MGTPLPWGYSVNALMTGAFFTAEVVPEWKKCKLGESHWYWHLTIKFYINNWKMWCKNTFKKKVLAYICMLQCDILSFWNWNCFKKAPIHFDLGLSWTSCQLVMRKKQKQTSLSKLRIEQSATRMIWTFLLRWKTSDRKR